jgi:hypothetical protein
MDRVMSTEQAGDAIGEKPTRLRELDRNGYVRVPRVGDTPVMAWRGVDVEIARVCAHAIDEGAGHYVVRQLAARLANLASAEAVHRYAARVALYQERGLWRLADGNLDACAPAMAEMAERVITFNNEEEK